MTTVNLNSLPFMTIHSLYICLWSLIVNRNVNKTIINPNIAEKMEAIISTMETLKCAKKPNTDTKQHPEKMSNTYNMAMTIFVHGSALTYCQNDGLASTNWISL